MKLVDKSSFYIRIGANHNQLSDVTKRNGCSEAVMELAAQKILKAGYNKRNVKCIKCYTLKSTNGHCLCDE